MKKLYITALCVTTLLISSCSKDFLKSYEKRIIGTWNITDVNRQGFGGSTSNLPFRDGTFTFFQNGTLTYVNSANVTYQGSWEIVKKTVSEESLHSLQITAIDFTNQRVLTEYYDDMSFSSSDHFKGYSISGNHTYVTHFRK